MVVENQVDVGSGFVSERLVPFPQLLVTATTQAAAQTLAGANSRGAMLIKRLAVVNASSAARALTLHAVPSGGSISSATSQLVGYAIDANSAVDLTEIIAGYYPSGTTLRVWADSANALVVSGYWADVA